jgi:DNA-binding MarR family transcriptional regulator
MSTPLIRKQVAAWQQLLICQSRIVRAVEREFESRGLVSFSFYDILLQLRHAPKREKRFREINGEVVLSRSALSRCVDRMAAAGLVEKLECPEDPRGLIVRITDQGEEELKKAWPVYRRLIESLFGQHFAADELEFLADRFANVTSHLMSQEISRQDLPATLPPGRMRADAKTQR